MPLVVVAVDFLPHAGSRETVPSKTTSAVPVIQRRRLDDPAPNTANPHSGNQRAYQNVGAAWTLAVCVGLVVVILRTDVADPVLLAIGGMLLGVKVQAAPTSATGVVGCTQLKAIFAGNPLAELGVTVMV